MNQIEQDIKFLKLDREFDYEKARENLRMLGYELHHRANHAGYISKRYVGYGIPHPYSGHFGRGLLIERHNPKARGYKMVEYWLLEDGA